MEVHGALLFLFLAFVVEAQYSYQGGQLPDHYPKYLKQGKYGQSFNTWKANESPQSPSVRAGYNNWKPAVKLGAQTDGNVGVKASVRAAPYSSYGTKTSGGWGATKRKAPVRRGTECQENPKAPLNSKLVCSKFSGCRATCNAGYQFPNGEAQLFITCQEGEWKVEHTEWEQIPACEPLCMPACENNGICVSPNKCNCPDNFMGPYCQFENKPCWNHTPLPMNSRRTCSSKQCIISCLKGYKFPDGSSTTNELCQNGQWVPGVSKWVKIPDCKPTCTPPCLNGGNCLSFNVCQCPQQFRGPQCQYNSDVCNTRKLQFNGGFNCTGDSVSLLCSVSCPSGIQFEFEPDPFYRCTYEEGIFKPQPVPQCIYAPVMPSIAGRGLVVGRSMPQFRVAEGLAKPGTCFTWGGTHYKTFDGKVYSFNGPCTHTLVSDVVDNTFSIVTQRDENCLAGTKCSPVNKLYIQDREYTLKKSANGDVPELYAGDKPLPIPSQAVGMRAELAAHHIVIYLDSVGVKLRWDGTQMIEVTVQESLWKRTGGLCGMIDGDAENDFTTKDGTVTNNVLTFASSWKVASLDGKCEHKPTDKHGCENNAFEQEATDFCKKLLNDKRFTACHDTVDIETVFEACRWDYCTCASEASSGAGKGTKTKTAQKARIQDAVSCACQTVDMYVRECKHKGVTALKQWRDPTFCPITCTGGRQYKYCGPAHGNQAVCGTSPSEYTDEVDPESCEEGCYCPKDTVLHDGNCITVAECPCRLRGKSFPPGETVAKDCNTCTCIEGQWQCTEVSCSARCSAVGDPHYHTFDGKKFDFMGQCSYILVQTDKYVVEAENVACAGSISQAMNFPKSVLGGMPSCTKTVTIRTPGEHVIKLKQNQEVLVNGKEVFKLPYEFENITIRTISSIFVVVDLGDGMEVWWDGVTRAYIEVPPTYKGKTKGLCGTFNSNQNDDFLTPEGDVEKSIISFANKWKTSEQCKDIPDVQKSHPCDINMQNKAAAEKHCSILKSKLFADCHWYVDPEIFYMDCLYDMCSCETNVRSCFCPMVAAYAKECSHKGVTIDWRAEIPDCGIQCPSGQVYKVCGNSCTRSCVDISLKPDCQPICVEGCNCPDGQTLDEFGECVPIGTCKCRQDGVEFPPGYKEIKPGTKKQQLCICTNAIWVCQDASDNEVLKYPRAGNLKTVCSATRNQIFTTCEPAEPKTCRNMHKFQPTSPAVCRPGCKCKDGYVIDAILKECIKPENCPCSHGGKSYKDGETIQSDCNTCKCEQAKWKCTTRKCAAECSAWGDSHYKTFDGKMYDYQGQCDYVFAKGTLSKTENFDVTIQNVPCSSLGVSCSKSTTIKVGSESITLTQGKQVPEHATFKRITVRANPISVTVEVEDLGLVVHWDRGTRVSIKLDPKWKGSVKGLCGNYNDNQMDDFQTPSGGISEVSTRLFGDSWKLESYCPEPVEIEDTCEQRPERRTWSVKRCSVLKSELFAPCHSEVEVGPWIERCIFDTCACDQGGDCECMCTALAAYAHECNTKGVPIRWRSQALCPMQCDETCAKYTPCMSSCPHETCDNMLILKKIGALCTEDTCVEGCAPKPCPPEHVYLNSSVKECVPKSECPNPVCMEDPVLGTLYEGDLIEEDDCHKCYCSKGNKLCHGEPCPTVTTTPAPSSDYAAKCVEGWTDWINQVVQDTDKPEGTYSEEEPLPSSTLLNNLRGPKCSIDEMVDIECRTVNGHKNYKNTSLNVECSLERGLVCVSQQGKGKKLCPDFEIRILCMCLETTTESYKPCDPAQPNKEHPSDCHSFYHCVPKEEGPELIEKSCGKDMMYNPKTQVCDWPASVIEIKPECAVTLVPGTTETTTESEIIVEAPEEILCPPGQEFSHCAYECHRMCDHYSRTVSAQGHCKSGQVCDEGCVDAERIISCPHGTLWRDNATCVRESDCVCMSHDGQPVKPATLYKESECEFCMCIDNSYVCDTSHCTTIEAATTEGGKEITTPVTISFVVTTVTPPLECKQESYINLIDGDVPLADESFSASSILTPAYAPRAARFSKDVSDKSAGSWSPEVSNKQQYIQVTLPDIEPVYGIILKGSPIFDQYVTSYNVLHSTDGLRFDYVPDKNKPDTPKLFRGNLDSKTPMKEMFDEPFETKALRISPQSWHDSIAVQLEIIGCKEMVTTVVSITTPKPICEDPMGVDNLMMSDEQIFVSSEKPSKPKQNLKLSSKEAWQPLTNGPTEWVKFDFIEPRKLTGIETKGGPDGWVSAYTAEYSHDLQNWNPILDDYSKEKLFLGNYDEQTPVVNNFAKPINARALLIKPKKWKDNIQMRIEPKGCFEPYEVLPTTVGPTKKVPIVSQCNVCPNVNVTSKMTGCQCEDLWWNGTSCVQRPECACIEGPIAYQVGQIYHRDDCSQCLCQINGIPHCKKKDCGKCPEDMRPVLTSSCSCVCKPCPAGQKLCPTSDICINETRWCDGVQDCPDDEVKCPSTPAPVTGAIEVPVTEPTISKVTQKEQKEAPTCQPVQCPPNYIVKKIESSENRPISAIISSMNGPKRTTSPKDSKKTSRKTDVWKDLSKPMKGKFAKEIVEKELLCTEFSCEPDPNIDPTKLKCKVTCPPGYKIIYLSTNTKKKEKCKPYKCEPPIPIDTTCEVIGSTFKTFDGMEYKYDICEHLLARDLEFFDWEIYIFKVCKDDPLCPKSLLIRHADEYVTLNPDLSIEYNGYHYTIAQTKKIGAKNKSFVVTRLGEVLLFVSNHYGFWVMWDARGSVKVGVVNKLMGKVDGLCGFFNRFNFDDKRKPNGEQARTTPEFGDSWFVGDEPCVEHVCPEELYNKAVEMCSKVKDSGFAACHSVVNTESFISHCVDLTCYCLENAEKNSTSDETCRCEVLQEFVSDCLSRDGDIDLSDWRVQHECPADCPPPLVHNDCFRKRCETSCSNLQTPDACPVVPMCFPGCYCPPGTVRKHNNCVQVKECRDCECNLLPNLKYVQFDGKNITVDTNCSYIMARDKIIAKGKKHAFQIVVSNTPCAQNPGKMCPEEVIIMYNNHNISIQRAADAKKLDVFVNDAELMKLPFKDDWLQVKVKGPKHINVLIPQIMLEVTAYFPTLGVSAKVPSHTYGGKLEGLCGNCNHKTEDDMLSKKGKPLDTIEEFTHDWMYGDAAQCFTEKIKECENVTDNPCKELLNKDRFGKCHMVLNTAIFEETCERDICGGLTEKACLSLETYAAGCAANGICTDWHIDECPAKICPEGQHYELCGSACAPTCDNYKTIKEKQCPANPVEGCFCPEGLVMSNGTCVEERLCVVCDKEGHHPGDKWQVDACTQCYCDLETSMSRCETQSCPSETVCETGYSPIKIEPSPDECCPKYICTAATASPTCEPPTKIACGPGQVMKLTTFPDSCQQFVCQCKPPEECDPIPTESPEPLPPGVERVIDTSGCCPEEKFNCFPENCPTAAPCQKFYELQRKKGKDDCCEQYKCVPPKDKCLYELKYSDSPTGGERNRTQYEKELITKQANETWQDGPCRQCKCISDTEHGANQPVCSITECPTLADNSDKNDYVLVEVPIQKQCCPVVQRTACKHDGKEYKVGEIFRVDDDPCNLMECVKTNDGLRTRIQKQLNKKSCDTECDPGSEYEPASPESEQCCGSCKPVACIVHGVERQVDETWTSDDFCTKFKCIDINGSLQVHSEVVSCPTPSKEMKENFVFEYKPIEGQCCGEHVPEGCKVGEKVYKINESWVDPTDKCKKIACVLISKDEIIKREKVKSCNDKCQEGWEYEPAPENSTKCCGKCIQVACVVNDTIYKPQETWQSEDGCINYECNWQGKHLGVISSEQVCPLLGVCPEENIVVDGCCKICNLTSQSQVLCAPTNMPLNKTEKLVHFPKDPHGDCWNSEPIDDFTECIGHCDSATLYNPESGVHELTCSCCSALKYRSISVHMECSDGHKFKKTLTVPSECGCESGCTGGGNTKTKTKTKTSSRTAPRTPIK